MLEEMHRVVSNVLLQKREVQGLSIQVYPAMGHASQKRHWEMKNTPKLQKRRLEKFYLHYS